MALLTAAVKVVCDLPLCALKPGTSFMSLAQD